MVAGEVAAAGVGNFTAPSFSFLHHQPLFFFIHCATHKKGGIAREEGGRGSRDKGRVGASHHKRHKSHPLSSRRMSAHSMSSYCTIYAKKKNFQ